MLEKVSSAENRRFPRARQSQDFHEYLNDYRAGHPDDVLVIDEQVSSDQDITAVLWALAEQGKSPLLVFPKVAGLTMGVATNIFGSRVRAARMLGATPQTLHEAYQFYANQLVPTELVSSAPILDVVERQHIDLSSLPMIRHFETDRAPYITNGIIVAEHPDTGAGNLSYHRAMLHSPTELATSLHSRGHLWRLLAIAKERKTPLPVAMVIGAHPLFMLAATARVPLGVDEREVAGGLFGEPLRIVKTPRYGIGVPACAEIVLEGVIDPTAEVQEGPFGEFTGYSSNRSTNNLLRVEIIMRRKNAMLIDVAGGNSAEHLNLGRIPRESEMVEKLKERFPSVTAVHYPSSGTHFHAYVALKQVRPGEARQVMLGLLGWDPYLKTVIAVDHDVDVSQDASVLWALATHFQPHRDILTVDGLPGSALDPSSSGIGTTSRMGLDATRGPDFDSVRAEISPASIARAAGILGRAGKL